MNQKALDQISRANARRFRKPKLSEADLERQCSDLLALDGWRSLKTDPVSDRSRGKGFGELGMADRLYIRYKLSQSGPHFTATEDALFLPWAEILWVEWKTKTGRAEDHQVAWHTAERARGALVLLAGVDFPAHFEGFTQFYAQSGLLRRKGLC